MTEPPKRIEIIPEAQRFSRVVPQAKGSLGTLRLNAAGKRVLIASLNNIDDPRRRAWLVFEYMILGALSKADAKRVR